MDRNRELVAALITIIFVTVAYLPVVTIERPQASSLIGHGIGIAGFVLMLATETLYSLRKRTRRMARWGRMRTWLSAHIFMGIVGPYLVFLHTGWQFAGLAGVTMLLTGVVVLSGFIGRYIYTAVPRTPSDAIVEKAQLERDIRRVEIELQTWLTARPSPLKNLVGQMEVHAASDREGYTNLFTRALADWRFRRHWRRAFARLDPTTRRQAIALEGLVRQRRRLEQNMAFLQSVRRMMALWHAVHVPLGLALFTAAFMHVVGALYYS